MTNSSLVIGQKLWFVPSQRCRAKEEVTVTKVGRKWATISNGLRIDLATWEADGDEYISPGVCYKSKDDYDARCRLRESWDRVRTCIARTYRVPCGFTQDTVDQLAKQFGLGREPQ